MAPPDINGIQSNNSDGSSSSTTSPTYGVHVKAPNVVYERDHIISNYIYENATVTKHGNQVTVEPTKVKYEFKTQTQVPKTGLMMVGWGGNNGSTLTATILANRNKISFHTKKGLVEPNYFGSVTQSATMKLGVSPSGDDVYVPLNSVLPMVHPNDIVLGGWDISSADLGTAMTRAEVLEYDLQRQVVKQMAAHKPLPSIYYPDFIAANQSDRADNLIPGEDKWAHVEHIRKDIRTFKETHSLDTVIVVWTANTERYADIMNGVNDTAENLLKSIKSSHSEISASTVFAVACILEHVSFINGSPQNTFVPGCIQLAEQHKTFIGGDDFKSGQTKIKSVLAQFMVDAGIRPTSIVSYNHLGNNDGKNLSAPQQFRSKEISKKGVVDDMIESNEILYNDEYGHTVDHAIVIKYVPATGDSKVAMDEYSADLMNGGKFTMSLHTVCEDSLLASPLIIDLAVIAELFSRVQYRTDDAAPFETFYPVLTVLSYWLKAPLERPGTEAINGLNKQRAALENLMRAFIGLAPNNEMK